MSLFLCADEKKNKMPKRKNDGGEGEAKPRKFAIVWQQHGTETSAEISAEYLHDEDDDYNADSAVESESSDTRSEHSGDSADDYME